METCRGIEEDQQRGRNWSGRKMRGRTQSRGSQGKEETIVEEYRERDRAAHTEKGGQHRDDCGG